MQRATVIIIGAGQAGLAMSYHLTRRSIDHVLLERGDVANSWRTERWDSLRLLTPNWQSRLPGYAYAGANRDGFRNMAETVSLLETYAQGFAAPVQTHTAVTSVARTASGYNVKTNRGDWTCRAVVLASGACNVPSVPRFASQLPASVRSITPMTYRNPDQLSPGGVLIVGASATGVQLAQEIQRSGRAVTVSTGEHVRLPRVYRGRDIQYWMDAMGLLDEGLEEIGDMTRARNLPSLQLIGSDPRRSLDLNTLCESGVEIVGRLSAIDGARAQFSGALANVCKMADLKMNRLLGTIDTWIDERGLVASVESECRFAPTRVPGAPILSLDLIDRGIETVIWATGYRPDYSWLDVPVTDHRGDLRHDGGVVSAPGLYAMGLPFMRRRKSSLIDGVGDDARDLSAHLAAYLSGHIAHPTQAAVRRTLDAVA